MAFHTLPVQSSPTSRMESRRASPGPGNTVLVVDQDPKAATLIAQELRRRGRDVAVATSSAEAFTSACDSHPAVMVVELGERAEGALPLLRTLAGDIRTQDIPVIVAQCEDHSSRAQAQRIGNVVVLLGDCSPETVAAEVDRLLLESSGSYTPPIPAYPMTCPRCGQKAAVPRSVATAGNGGTYISMHCEKCAQEWRVFRQADTPGFVKL